MSSSIMTMEYTDLKHELVNLYRQRAERYDLTANLYYLLGYPEWRYRRQTVTSLDVQPGDMVVEIGCGTGLNFELLRQRIGYRYLRTTYIISGQKV